MNSRPQRICPLCPGPSTPLPSSLPLSRQALLDYWINLEIDGLYRALRFRKLDLTAKLVCDSQVSYERIHMGLDPSLAPQPLTYVRIALQHVQYVLNWKGFLLDSGIKIKRPIHFSQHSSTLHPASNDTTVARRILHPSPLPYSSYYSLLTPNHKLWLWT